MNLYRWTLADTGEVIELGVKPEEGQESKLHIVEDGDLGTFGITYIGPVPASPDLSQES